MPSDTLPLKPGTTAMKTKQLSAATLKDGMFKPKAQDERLQVNIVKATVPNHDKLKAYLGTKAKDDPWSPYTMQNAGAGASDRERNQYLFCCCRK